MYRKFKIIKDKEIIRECGTLKEVFDFLHKGCKLDCLVEEYVNNKFQRSLASAKIVGLFHFNNIPTTLFQMQKKINKKYKLKKKPKEEEGWIIPLSPREKIRRRRGKNRKIERGLFD